MSNTSNSFESEKDALYERACRMAVSEGRPMEALRELDNFLSATQRDDVDLLLLRGNILDQLGEYQIAAKVYHKILRLSPGNPRALIDLGDSWSRYKGQPLRGLHYYSRALTELKRGRVHESLDEELLDAYTGKARALLEMRRAKEALKFAQGALRRFPGDPVLAQIVEQAQLKASKRLPD